MNQSEHLQFQIDFEAHLNTLYGEKKEKPKEDHTKKLIEGMLKLTEEVIKLKTPIQEEKPEEESMKEFAGIQEETQPIQIDEFTNEFKGMLGKVFKQFKIKKKNA